MMIIVATAVPAATAGSPDPCAVIDSAAACVRCAAATSPEVREAEAALAGAESEAEVAGAIEDPTLEGAQTVAVDGETRVAAELRQNVPLNGAPAAREAAARARLELLAKVLQATRLDIGSQVARGLLRLRQIEHELELLRLQEGLAVKALERLAGLAVLTVEQTASRRAFEWNRSALARKLAGLESERDLIRVAIVQIQGGREPRDWGLATAGSITWPAWPTASAEEPLSVVVADAELRASRAESRVERSLRWSGLGVGAVVESEPGALGVRENFLGLSVGVSLPVFNRNRAAIARRAAEERQSEIRRESTGRNVGLARVAAAERYRRAVALLVAAEDEGALAMRELVAIQSAYLAGRMPATSALESFRQLQESVEEGHTLERSALEALLEAYALDADLDAIIRVLP